MKAPAVLLSAMFAFIFGVNGFAAEPVRLALHSTPSEIRNARNAEPGREWLIRFEVTKSRPGSASGEKPTELEVGLGPEYLRLGQDGNIVIYDFTLRRIIRVDPGKRRFFHHSLYAHVLFRARETVSRLNLRKIVLKAVGKRPKIDAIMSDRFWIETEFGIETGKGPGPELAVRGGGTSALSFSYKGETIVRVRFSDQAVPKNSRRMWAHFLRFGVSLHPRIVSRILEQGFVPDRLEYRVPSPKGAVRTQLRLRGAAWREIDYPLPPDYTLAFGEFVPRTLRGMLPIMIAAVTGKFADGPPTANGFARKIKKYLNGNDVSDSALLALEARLTFPRLCAADSGRYRDFCETVSAGLKSANKSLLFRNVGRALEYEKKNRFDKAYSLLARTPLDGVDAGYIVHRLIANDLATLIGGTNLTSEPKFSRQRAEVEKRFSIALQGNPYFRNLYRDIGNYYQGIFRTDLAWIVFDLGRVLPAPAKFDLLRPIGRMEQMLLRRHPEHF